MIQGPRHVIYTRSRSEIAIGCKVCIAKKWLENYKSIGKANGYSEREIEKYGKHIKFAAEWLSNLTEEK